MTALTDFLLARIAEDDLSAALASSRGVVWPGLANYAAGETTPEVGLFMLFAGSPARALAECEAKRRIVAEHPPYSCSHTRCGGSGSHCGTCGTPSVWPCATLTALALPYADHPDYRQEWKS